MKLDGFALPVKKLKGTDPIETLDLSGKNLGVSSAVVIASLIGVNGALTVANLMHNQLDAESAKMLAEVAKQKGVSLCGIQRDQTTADLSGHALKPPDAILLASDLSQVVVTGGLTSLNLSNNLLCGVTTFGSGTYTAEGITAIAEALRVNGALTSIDLSRNMLCGIWTDDDVKQRGNYITEGLNAIADALHVNGALTMLSLAKNRLGEEGTEAICEALEQNKTLKELDISGHYGSNYGSNIGGSTGAKHVAKMLGINGGLTKISLARNKLGEKSTKVICEALKQNKTLKELNLSGSNIGGAAGAKHVADMLGVNGALTVTNLLGNQLDAESAKMLAEVAKQKGISLCGIQRDQTTADFRNKRLQPPDAILLASDLSQAVVTGALTSVKLSGNRLGDEGWGAIFAAICGSKDSKIMSLDASCENISPAGVQLIAEALRTSVTGALTQVLALSDTPKTAFSVTLTFAFALNGISAGHLKQPAMRPQ